MRHERQRADDDREREAERHAGHHGTGAELQAIALKKEHDLEALAVDGSESEEREAGARAATRKPP